MAHWDFRRSINSMQILAAVGQEHGLSLAQLLNNTGLNEARLQMADAEVEAGQELQLVRNLLRGCPDVSGLGMLAGRRYHISSYGLWGFAMMSSPSLRTALALGLRLVSLSFVFVRLQVCDDPEFLELRVDDSEIPQAERLFLVERDMVAALQLVNELCAAPLPLHSVSFAFPAPPHTRCLQALFACPVQFDADHSALRVNNALLDLPLPQANTATVKTCEQLCLNLLEQRRHRNGVAARIRQRLMRSDDPFPGLEQLATELALTSRSLRRHLAAEGTSFRDLLDECRELLAEQLLGQMQLPVEDVAERLGYAEASSFILAFKRWKGVTPRQFTIQAGNGPRRMRQTPL